MLLVTACAEGTLDEAELGLPSTVNSKSDSGTRAKDARVSADEAADTVSSARDAGAQSGSGRDAGSSSASVGAIKCPSPMICSDMLSTILSVLDSTIKAGPRLCATSGSLLPMATSCKTVDECKSARLTTSTCSGGYCIQPCTP